MPLILKYPLEIIEPEVISSPVSLIDILPTVMEFYQFPAPGFVQGDSLLQPAAKRKNYIISEAVSISGIERKMIRVGDLKYIITMKKPSGPKRVNWDAVVQRRLFDLKNDPEETKDVYSDLKFRGLCINFEKLLRKVIKKSSFTNQRVTETTVDDETLNQMKALGYL